MREDIEDMEGLSQFVPEKKGGKIPTIILQARNRGYKAGKDNLAPSSCPEYSAKDAKVRNAFMEGFYKGFMEFKKNGN